MRGGPRPGAGRPRHKLLRVTVDLRDPEARKLERIAEWLGEEVEGVVSRILRAHLRAVMDWPTAPPGNQTDSK